MKYSLSSFFTDWPKIKCYGMKQTRQKKNSQISLQGMGDYYSQKYAFSHKNRVIDNLNPGGNTLEVIMLIFKSFVSKYTFSVFFFRYYMFEHVVLFPVKMLMGILVFFSSVKIGYTKGMLAIRYKLISF